MIRMSRTAGLVFAVVFAINLVAIAGAQAEPEFQALETVKAEEWEEENPVHATLSATQVESEQIKLTLGGISIRCGAATASGTLETGSSPTMTLLPTYSKCKAGILFPAEVSTNGCSYGVHSAEQLEADLYKAQADLTCPAGKEITATIKNPEGTKSLCVVHVAPQSNLAGVKVQDTTEATPDNIAVKNEIGTIKAVVTNGEAACLITPGSYGNTQLTGTTTVTAKSTAKETPPINYDLLPSRKFHFAGESAGSLTRLTGLQDSNLEFSFSFGKVKCMHMLWEQPNYGTAASNAVELYGESAENCTEGGAESSIEFNGCRYRLEAKANEHEVLVGNTIVICPALKAIEVSAPACTARIPGQTGPKGAGLGRITFENLGTGANREVRAQFAVRNLEYEELGLGCKAANVMTTTGRYDGSMFLRAAKELGGNQIGFWTQKTP
jgi:hypothetical protein